MKFLAILGLLFFVTVAPMTTNPLSASSTEIYLTRHDHDRDCDHWQHDHDRHDHDHDDD